jgi:hypothetical protein
VPAFAERFRRHVRHELKSRPDIRVGIRRLVLERDERRSGRTDAVCIRNVREGPHEQPLEHRKRGRRASCLRSCRCHRRNVLRARLGTGGTGTPERLAVAGSTVLRHTSDRGCAAGTSVSNAPTSRRSRRDAARKAAASRNDRCTAVRAWHQRHRRAADARRQQVEGSFSGLRESPERFRNEVRGVDREVAVSDMTAAASRARCHGRSGTCEAGTKNARPC